MFPMFKPNLTANGNVRPNRFLTTVSGNGNFLLAVEATASTSIIIGVSESYVRGGAVTYDTTYIAIANEELPYRAAFEEGSLLLGGTVSDMGTLLTTDNQGRGVAQAVSNGTTCWYGAMALEAGVTGDIIRVLVLPPTPTC